MVFFSLLELLNLLIATTVVGYIFSGSINFGNDLIQKRFDWNRIKYGILVAAPGVILHELAHKFVAIGFGLDAVFEIWLTGLFIGIILRAIGSSFILLAPGYVSIQGISSAFQSSITSLAGPLTNCLLWLIASFVVKHSKKLSREKALFFLYTAEINKWLFLFNMLPIPPLDGYKVFGYLFF